MTTLLSPLLAAEGVTRTTFEWARIQSRTDWVLPIGLCVVLLVFVRYMYIRDSKELHPLLGWLLTLARSAALVALLVLYLDPTWRTEREVTRPSRAVLLVDTSLSMGTTDVESPDTPGSVSRAQQVVDTLQNSELLDTLRKVHEVVVWRFDEDLKRLVPLDKLGAGAPGGDSGRPSGDEPGGDDTEGEEATADGSQPAAEPEKRIDWAELLRPSGNETRLGRSLKQLIADERSSPLSGVVLVSDGGQNAGETPETALELAREAKVPVAVVGIGSDRKAANVRISDVVAPARAYPGDRFTITAYVQAQEMAEQRVTVELLWRPAASRPTPEDVGTGQIESTSQVILGTDGEVLPVKFEVAPPEPGRRIYCVRVQAPKTDSEPGDDFDEATVEIVDRKNRVLLVAGGPTREYQFVRNLLYRDNSTTVDVYLQTAQPGISQDADKILDEFPSDRTELFEYDCIVAFDPNWQEIGVGPADDLENWVAEQGGGLIAIAGPVNTGRAVGGWVQDPSMAKVRSLYPVEFIRRITVIDDTGYTAEEPWPLEFTREGLEARYLWLGDTASASQAVWTEFRGVFSHFPVRGAKPGATVLARFSDPRSGSGEELAPYFVTQFYGSGRVFFTGSGEMWRLRAVDDTHFEQFYTKLIRHVSQGRLLRGSARGVLLVGQDQYQVGNTVEVRAQLNDAQMKPLRAEAVAVQIMHRESGSAQPLSLAPDPTREGTFAGQFTVLKEGTYRLELPVPETEDERLEQTIKVVIPKLEKETPQRNDALLSTIAKGTGGAYYVGFEEALAGAGDKAPVFDLLKDRTRTSILLEAPNPERKERWLRWILGILCGVLFFEWTVRRLVRLA